MATKSGNYWTCDGKGYGEQGSVENAPCKNAVFIERTAPNPTPDNWITVESYKDGQGTVKTYCCKKCLLSDNG